MDAGLIKTTRLRAKLDDKVEIMRNAEREVNDHSAFREIES